MNKQLAFLLLLCFAGFSAVRIEAEPAAEKGPWDFTVGLGGTESVNSGISADTLFWGPFARIAFEISDPLHARLGLRHTQNKFLYNGLGDIARQSNTGFSPGINWEITPNFSVDAEYNFRIGENEYREHAGVLGVEFTPLTLLRFGADMSFNQQNYVFPVTEEKVTVKGWSGSLEAALVLSKQVEIPILFSLSSSRYNTNGTTYTVRTVTPGVTLRTVDRVWSLTVAAILGTDSSKYSIFGGEARVRYKWNDHVFLRLGGMLSHYSYTVTKTNRSGKFATSTDVISPVGNTDTFNVYNLSLEVSHNF